MLLLEIEAGARVFIDANIFVYHFTASSRFNASYTSFLDRVERGEIHGVTTAAVVLETTHRILIEEALVQFPQIKPRGI